MLSDSGRDRKKAVSSELAVPTKTCRHVQPVGRRLFPCAVAEQPGVLRVNTHELFGDRTTHCTQRHVSTLL